MTRLATGIAAYRDAAAATFEDEPDHGLRAASTRDAWERLLADWLPPHPADVPRI